jgi:hypothetical protein
MNQSESQPRLKALLVIILQGNEDISKNPTIYKHNSMVSPNAISKKKQTRLTNLYVSEEQRRWSACRRRRGGGVEFHVDLRSKTSQYFCDFIIITWKVLFYCRVKQYDNDFCYLHYIIYVAPTSNSFAISKSSRKSFISFN